jgi:AraC-like DNA-binding protein
MGHMRHKIVRENDPGPGVSVSTFSRDYARGSNVAVHAHLSDQLIYASRGVMQVASGQNRWIIPPHFGLWIPARIPHQIRMPEPVSMRTLYLRPGLAGFLPSCAVLHIGPFLRELIFEIVRTGSLRTRNVVERALRVILVAHLRQASSVPTGVAVPQDPRALKVAQTVIANPALRQSLVSICASAGVGVRTLERTYRREIGMDFESWRRQVRLMKAIELLVAGQSVKQVAFSVGYQDTSGFVDLFRKTFGTTPKMWISTLGGLGFR